MKTLMTALVLVSTTAFAQMTTLPVTKMVTETVLKIDQVSQEVRSINVTDNGTVIVVPRFTRNLVIFQLSPSNKSEILSNVGYLSDAALETDQRAAVCEMMADPNTTRSVLILDSSKQMREVLSPVGCMYVTFTHPKYDYQTDVVKELKAKLIALTLQHLGY